MDGKKKEKVIEYGLRARKYFESGYNCSQSVVLAFKDKISERILEEEPLVSLSCEPFGIPVRKRENPVISDEVLLRLAAPFGGGFGRLRQMCGAVSGMGIVLGFLEGYADPKAGKEKQELYAVVQALAGRFADENGSFICGELLGVQNMPVSAVPERRTEEYYKKRPCADLCESAACILAEYIISKEVL